jgi:cytochrome c-type biogenesis protein CcmH/NrfG
MTSMRIAQHGMRISQHAATPLSLVMIFLLTMPGWSWGTVPPSASDLAAATLKRDSERCRAQANLDACYDAIRWSPRDPALLVALGDALERANRPVEAVRAYRRAVALAPSTPGVAAKISAAEAKQGSKRGSGGPSTPDAAAHAAAANRRASNADPVAQSH